MRPKSTARLALAAYDPRSRALRLLRAVASLCRRLRDACVACSCPGRGLAALCAAARKAAPTPAHLTPAHVDVLQLSLLARNFAAALPLLEEDIFEVVPALTGVVPKDFLLYCYYGGACLCAVKRFGAAVDLFMQALAAPALALNAIQLACYKKMARDRPALRPVPSTHASRAGAGVAAVGWHRARGAQVRLHHRQPPSQGTACDLPLGLANSFACSDSPTPHLRSHTRRTMPSWRRRSRIATRRRWPRRWRRTARRTAPTATWAWP